jgi:hypothetical protein
VHTQSGGWQWRLTSFAEAHDSKSICLNHGHTRAWPVPPHLLARRSLLPPTASHCRVLALPAHCRRREGRAAPDGKVSVSCSRLLRVPPAPRTTPAFS